MTVSLTTPGCPIRSHFQDAVVQQVSSLDGVTGVGVGFDVLPREEKAGLMKTSAGASCPRGAGPGQERDRDRIRQGRVGKSTMTANLAAAIRAEGLLGRRPRL